MTISMSPELATFLLLGGVLLGVLVGFPLGVMVAAVAVVVGTLMFGFNTTLNIMYTRIFRMVTDYTFLACPLFVFMGCMLERSGVIERLFGALYMWLGQVRGGLALITVVIGAAMAACVGIIAASITMLTVIALPAMIDRGYDKSLACGTVCAGGTLGILIPPSVMLVFYGPMAEISVGKLFFGAFIPGFMLAGLYLVYIALRGLLQPSCAPAVSTEEAAQVSFRKKTVDLAVALVPLAILIISVLGVIYLGIAPPTEAAGAGAFAATMLVVAYRRFNWSVLRDTAFETFKISSMIMLMAGMSFAYTGILLKAGAGGVMESLILGAPGGRWGAFVLMHLIILALGMFIDWTGIVFIMIPVITPIAAALEFHPVWFAITVCVNMQMAFMTPPFAGGIFILRGAAPPRLGVTTGHIISGVIPFILIVMVAVVLLAVFPQLVTWLPDSMIQAW